MWNLTRRSFLAGSTVAFAQPPSDQLRVGLIGAGGRGRYLLKLFQKEPGVRVVAVCDVYEPNLERGLSQAGPGTRPYRDYRALLENKDIDIVIIATPEHWHHRMVLDALAAGKDIYVEKPLCHTPEEGVELVRAARQSDRVIQVGMQRRSYHLFHEARQLIASGRIGTVRMVRSWWLNNNADAFQPRKLEGPLDWEQWQGPAPRRPLDPMRFYHWRFYSDYSGGIVADQGAHVFDGIHFLMGASYVSAVTAAAGKPHRPGVDTPESVVVVAEYPEDFVAVFTINYAAMKYAPRNDQLNQFDGDRARLDLGREELKVFDQGAEDIPAISSVSKTGFGQATEDHVKNFLECVRTRRQPNAPVEAGFQAALVVQLANLSLRHGCRVRWDAREQRPLLG